MALTRRELAKRTRGEHPRDRVLIARTLVWAGRGYLAVLGIVLVGSWLARPVWMSAPRLTGTPSHWIADVTLAFLLALAIVWPLLLLPVSSLALTSADEAWLSGMTVLGRRRVEADSVRTARITLPGRGYSTYVATLRDRRLRFLIVVGSGMWEYRHFEAIAGYPIPDPHRHARAMSRYLIGAAVIGVSVFFGIALMLLLGALVGLFQIS
jgi:hypothetical protein